MKKKYGKLNKYYLINIKDNKMLHLKLSSWVPNYNEPTLLRSNANVICV